MNEISTYNLISAFVFGYLAIIWNKSNYLNLFIKLIFFLLSIVGFLIHLDKW